MKANYYPNIIKLAEHLLLSKRSQMEYIVGHQRLEHSSFFSAISASVFDSSDTALVLVSGTGFAISSAEVADFSSAEVGDLSFLSRTISSCKINQCSEHNLTIHYSFKNIYSIYQKIKDIVTTFAFWITRPLFSSFAPIVDVRTSVTMCNLRLLLDRYTRCYNTEDKPKTEKDV